MKIKNNIKIHNRFDIEIVDKNTGKVKQSLISYNIVLSQMYTRLCGGLAYFTNIHFGSGTGTLSPSRTTLFSHLGTKSAVDEEIIKAVPLSSWKRKIVLNPEEYVGNTISEVGIAYGSTNTNLVTHSLLKDSEGNSISIVKTDVDVITIYATVFVTLDTSNSNLTYLSMPSSNQLVNYLIGGSTAPTGAFSVDDSLTSRVPLGTTSTVTWTSDTVNKQRKTNVVRFVTTVGNGHINRLNFTNLFSLKLPALGIFEGQNYEDVSIGSGDGLKKIFNIPSANVNESGIILKINGIVTNAYNIIERLGYRSPNLKSEVSVDNYAGTFKISRNGNTLCITSQSTKYIQVFDKVENSWIRRQNTPTMTNDVSRISVSDDGSVVCASSGSSVYIFRWDGSSWSTKTIAGQVVSLSINGDGTVLLTAFDYGTNAKVYDWVGGEWVLRVAILSPGNNYALNCLISQDGNTVIIVNVTAPKIHIYDWSGSIWVKRSTFPNPYSSFDKIALSNDKQFLVVGPTTSDGGKVRAYKWNESVWEQYGDFSGWAYNRDIAISNDGNIIHVCGMNYLNYAFVLNGDMWETYPIIFESNGSVASYIDFVDPNEVFMTNGGMNCFKMDAINFISVELDIAPAIGDVITADYTVDGVHKTDQYVIDASFAIQFGEI